MKTDVVRARMEPHLRTEVHAVLNELGVTPTQAITMFYKFIQRKHGLPFELSLPNAETAKAIEDAKQHKNIASFKDATDLFKQLNLKC